MSVIGYIKIGKLVLIWLGATGKCIKVKKAAGETIDIWDWLMCAVSALSSIEDDLVPLIQDQVDRSNKK